VQPALARIRSLLQDRIDKQVVGILKQELDNVFKAESEEVARQIISESYGPGPYSDEVKKRIQRITDRCRANAFAALRGPWGVNCPNCDFRHSYAFDDGMIRTLVPTSLLRVECRHRGLLMHLNYQKNPNIQAVVEFTLRGVIRTYMLAA